MSTAGAAGFLAGLTTTGGARDRAAIAATGTGTTGAGAGEWKEPLPLAARVGGASTGVVGATAGPKKASTGEGATMGETTRAGLCV